ncbi:hypothetical protein KR074_005265 [Drosophila pseudoananassae]|nr:hypothetical protein KR074_005265 [Drosophila pseudoananassae]
MEFSQSLNFGNSTFLQLERGIQDAGKNNLSAANEKDARETSGNIEDNYSDFFKSDFSIIVQQSNDPHESEQHVNVSRIEAILCISHNECGIPLSPRTIKSRLYTEDEFGKEDEKEQDPEPETENHETSFLAPVEDHQASEQLKADIIRSCMVAQQGELHEVSKMTQNLSSMSPGQLRLSPDSFSQVNYGSRRRSVASEVPVDLQAMKSISAWNLPPSISSVYKEKGVIQMFDWQVECLSKRSVLCDHGNLVYSAPTSAGKTLVSEILLIKTVLERRKKVLLILPFISVVREKMFYLQDLLTMAGYRVEGFFGGYNPPGGFENIDVAICTIEKANSIINKLLEQDKLDSIGTVVVDEVHLISDKGRGYILELLLAKVLYVSRRKGLQIQVITMSATLANVELLQRWLDAELYITDYRPVALNEMIKVGTKIFDNQLRFVRDVSQQSELQQALGNDSDHVAQLCIETVLESCSVIVFCPSKDWCENLAVQLATAMHTLIKSGSDVGRQLRSNLSPEALENVKQQLRDIPTGLDSVMSKAVTCACAFHHAGLTTEERDIVETAFKSGALKVLVATSTLSSGVNLPARRVIIRSPLFGGKQMSSLTYRQMIGRAGRTGKDTLGESILICTESNARVGRELVTAQLQPISSCLEMDGSTHLKRALLEVISSGVATTRQELDLFVNCTLLSAQKAIKRAENPEADKEQDSNYINDALEFLIEYEFIRLQTDEVADTSAYVATRLGAACLASSMPPTDGLLLFAELQKSRRCFVLESELHAVYLVTPYTVCYQLQDLDWLIYLDMWEKLNPAMKRVGELVGVKESFLVKAMRGQTNLDYKQMQVHKRFYTALALQELVNETPINVVVHKFKCHRGMLQTLQQMASTFAGIVSAFCTSLQWSTLALIVSEFKDRLYFGIHSDLIDLMRLPDLTQKRARALYDAGFKNLVQLAGADVLQLEKVLYNSLSFDSAKQHDHENAEDAAKRNMVRNFFITGKAGMTVAEASKLLISEARQFVQYEFGAGSIKWSQEQTAEVAPELEVNKHKPQEDNLTTKSTTKSKVSEKMEVHMSEGETHPRSLLKRKLPTKESIMGFVSSPEKQPKVMNEMNSNTASHGQILTQPSTSAVPARVSPEKVQILNCVEISPNGVVSEHEYQSPVDAIVNGTNGEPLHTIDLQTNMVTNSTGNTMEHENFVAESPSQFTKPQSVSLNATEPKPSERSEAPSANVQVQDIPIVSPAEILKKQVEERKRLAQLKINKKLEEMKSQRQPAVARTVTVLDTLPKRGLDKPISQKIPRVSKSNTQVETGKDPSSSSGSSESAGTLSEMSKGPTRVSVIEEDLFVSEDSFMMTSSLNEALTAADRKPQSEGHSETEEIPNSQPKEPETVTPLTPHASRIMRSNTLRSQRLQSPRSVQSRSSATESNFTNASGGSSGVELSNVTQDNSLFKNPLELNTSYVLSCPTNDNDSTSITQISVSDVCESVQMFEIASKKLSAATVCGLSVGVKDHAGNPKPLIGGNLVNPMGEVGVASPNFLFQVNDTSYLECLSFCLDSQYVIHFQMQETDGVPTSLKLEEVFKIFARKNLTLIMHKTKNQLKALLKAIPELKTIGVKFEDPDVANWLLQPDQNYDFKNMCQQYAPECSKLLDLCGSNRFYSSYGLSTSSETSVHVRTQVEAYVSFHILKGQNQSLEELQLMKVFRDNEMPLHLILARMEVVGFPAKENRLKNFYKQIMNTSLNLHKKIMRLNGSNFNINSSDDVARVVGLHRKPTVRVSTSRQVLERVEAPIAKLISQHRKLTALVRKTVQPMMKACHNNRICGHSITNTATGRISMAEPNLQNVAKDFVADADPPVLLSCRTAFTPIDSTRCLISADFCQLEMRILAHLSQDKALLAAINSPSDIFASISAHWHGLDESEVSDQLREGTKKICYGIIYGMGIRSLASELKVTEQEASAMTMQFNSSYPGIRAYTEKVIIYARNKGYVETMTGRRRYLENILSEENALRKKAERQAVNTAIQGSAADLVKSSLIKTTKHLSRLCQKFHIDEDSINFVLHIHDELMFEVPVDTAKKVSKLLKIVMESGARLTVPLKVKIKMGSCWGNLKEIQV